MINCCCNRLQQQKQLVFLFKNNNDLQEECMEKIKGPAIFLAQFVRYENDSYSFDTKESRKLTFDKLFFIISIIAPLIYFIVYLMHNEILSAYMQKITLSLMLVSIFFLDYEDV